jgi:hypothetical protein
VPKVPPKYRDYHDAQGRPQLAEAFVLFLDLLGTRAATAADANRILDVTVRALHRATDWTDGGDASSTVVKWFSDNLGLAERVNAFPPDLTFGFQLITAAWVQLELAMLGLFSRGGMTVGDFFANEMFVYGPALVEAVELESKQAVNPRIVLSKRLADFALAELRRLGGGDTEVHRKLLAVDPDDGLVFVDYLSSIYDEPEEVEAFVLNHKGHITSRLKHHKKDEHILRKYEWLASYHDRFCRREFMPDYIRSHDLVIGNVDGPKLERFGGDVPIPEPPPDTGLPF